jgi:hypothetical protein
MLNWRKGEFQAKSSVYCTLRPTIEIKLSNSGLSKIGNKRYHSYHDEPDAHQIIEDFGKDHHHDTEDKGDYSSNQT